MIRFLLLNAFVGIHTLIFSIWACVLCLFDKDGTLVHSYSAVPWARIMLWVSGIRVKAEGQENADPGVPCVYMSNHQSYFDILALLAYVPVSFKFIVKQELMRIPIFGLAMRRAGYIGIERKDHRKAIQSMNKAAEKMRNGVSVLIFPEGTRSVDGRLQEFKRGGFILAIKSGCAIVPVALNNSYRIAPKGSLRINKMPMDIHIGKPISVKDYTKKETHQLMDRVREAMLSHIDQADPDPGPRSPEE